jgi:protein phosphatase
MSADLSRFVEVAARSDAGRVRPHNEDSVFVDAAIGLAVVADGMGGYNAGEVASGMATTLLGEALQRVFDERTVDDRRPGRRIWDHDVLDHEIARVNAIIYETALTQPQCSGMGTTLVMALFHDNSMTVAHLGDSRLYRLRGGKFEQITRDHSLLQEQIDSGVMTAEQARISINKNLVTRALGVDPVAEPEIRDYSVQAGDMYLLCTDGLPDMVDDETLAEELGNTGSADLDLTAGRLVDLANEGGGRDNISVVLVRIRQAFPAARGWWARLLAWFK